ncbi:MAG TPA: ADP-forming succinate--CoA ligase subunit beta [Gammaproteobacteria bacterium]|jgi:succinyl-CoA synthetase beta subunit|nr:ADP-forming succinate--CoA ligase subunit beta [Gammaproteobacteria bacterium]
MNLHEYQAKALFSHYGIPVPASVVVRQLGDLREVYARLDDNAWAVKAQVHAGGRGKGGGIKIVHGRRELAAAVSTLLGSRLVTPQTDTEGLPVNALLVETLTDIEREYYLGLLIDRTRRRITVMASAAGGMNIEAVAATTPERIFTITIHPAIGLMPYQGRRLGFALGLTNVQVRQVGEILQGLYELFVQNDASLVEINPLVVTKCGQLLALDAKINLDDNALFRHADLIELRDASQENEREARAKQLDLNYIKLDGNIGCMVNGAGLAMATMDVIKLHGGRPANFLDVGGNATAERVTAAFTLILSDPHVKAMLVNIFGGIVRCDLIAEGIIDAVRDVHVTVPVVVRLAGTNVDRGRQLLAESGLNIIAAEGLSDAADKAVKSAAL